MPRVKDLSDIYPIGVICEAHAVHDPNNIFMPYILNLFGKHMAEMLNLATDESAVGPLCRVLV